LYCWGLNVFCEVSDPTAGDKSNEIPYLVTSLMGDVAAVSCGGFFTLALLFNGTVWSWGSSIYDELGQGSTTVYPHCVPHQINIPETVMNITSGNADSCAITQGSGVYCWGYDAYGGVGDGYTTNVLTPVKVNLTNVTDISAGNLQVYAIVSGNTLYGWGSDIKCQLAGVATPGNQLVPALLPGIPPGFTIISKGSSSDMGCVAVN